MLAEKKYIYIYFIPLAAKEILEIKNGSFGYLMVLDLEEDMARAFSKPFAKSIIDSWFDNNTVTNCRGTSEKYFIYS